MLVAKTPASMGNEPVRSRRMSHTGPVTGCRGPQANAMQGAEVFLHVYDLGDGWLTANSVSSDLLNLGGAFHVGVEVYMTEFYFGSEGVATCLPKMADGTRVQRDRQHGQNKLDCAAGGAARDADALERQ